MLSIYTPYFAILIGFIGLIWSADRFVNGAAAIAANFGMPTLLIGLTIVAFGTSAPEILVSINAGLSGAGDLAVGNAIGSNLANIGLVLGVTALIAPIPISKRLLRREGVYLLLATTAGGVILYDLIITWQETLALILLLVWIIYRLVKNRNQHPAMAEAEETEELNEITQLPLGKAIGLFVIGLILLIVSSDVLVWGATEAAKSLGVSELVIGLTVVAIGTSLPELAASVASSLKGHHDIALGNVLGSNIFNLLAVMAVPAFFGRMTIGAEAFQRDFASMAFMTLLLLSMMFIGVKLTKNSPKLARWTGVFMITPYVAYFAVLFSTHGM